MRSESLKLAEENQLRSLELKTGRKLIEWAVIVSESRFSRQSELVYFLKKRYALGHGFANMIVHWVRESKPCIKNMLRHKID